VIPIAAAYISEETNFDRILNVNKGETIENVDFVLVRGLDPALTKAPPEHNHGPVGDWLDAIAHQREPECSGRNGAWAVEMAMGVYQATLTGRRVSFPLAERGHPLAPSNP
jgi:hypothetical protein